MNSPIISIIIPAYNLQDYIGRCLDSILAQTFKDFEAIVINDGSDDTTWEICKFYRKKDNRIKIFNQENSGLGFARNHGLGNATGEFIAFVDGDDIIHQQYLEILYSVAIKSGADIAVCNYIKGCDENLMFRKNYNVQHNYIQIMDKKSLLYKLYNEHPFITVWAKLYRKNIIKSGFVAKGIGEDVEFNSRMNFIANKVVYVDYPLYFWETRNSSLSNSSFNDTNLNKIKNYFYAWVNLRKNKFYSNYALKKLYKTFLSIKYDGPDEYKSTLEKTIKYCRKLSIKYLYRDVFIIDALIISFLLFTPSIYQLFRKYLEKFVETKRKLIPIHK